MRWWLLRCATHSSLVSFRYECALCVAQKQKARVVASEESGKPSKKTSSGVATVQKVDARAERIAARIAAGEDGPSLFGK